MFALNCIELFIILAFAVIGCTRISAIASLFGISVGIMSSVIGLKVCAIAAAIESKSQ